MRRTIKLNNMNFYGLPQWYIDLHIYSVHGMIIGFVMSRVDDKTSLPPPLEFFLKSFSSLQSNILSSVQSTHSSPFLKSIYQHIPKHAAMAENAYFFLHPAKNVSLIIYILSTQTAFISKRYDVHSIVIRLQKDFFIIKKKNDCIVYCQMQNILYRNILPIFRKDWVR